MYFKILCILKICFIAHSASLPYGHKTASNNRVDYVRSLCMLAQREIHDFCQGTFKAIRAKFDVMKAGTTHAH